VCCCLAGDDATPENKSVQQALSAMLTPYLFKQISLMTTREVDRFKYLWNLPPEDT